MVETKTRELVRTLAVGAKPRPNISNPWHWAPTGQRCVVSLPSVPRLGKDRESTQLVSPRSAEYDPKLQSVVSWH